MCKTKEIRKQCYTVMEPYETVVQVPAYNNSANYGNGGLFGGRRMFGYGR